jgi:hypothetical protein
MGAFSLEFSNAAAPQTSAGISAATVEVGTRSIWNMTFERARTQPAGVESLPVLFTGRYDLNKNVVLSPRTPGEGAVRGELSEHAFSPERLANPRFNLDDLSMSTTNGYGYHEHDRFNELIGRGGRTATSADPVAYPTSAAQNRRDSLANRTARVSFREEVLNSWIASQRNTIFTLPEGVKFLRVDLAQITGLGDSAGNTGRIRRGMSIYNEHTTPQPFLWHKEDALGNVFILADQTLELINIERQTGTRVELELDIWVSIAPDFAPADGSPRDITLTISGEAVGSAEFEPVVIAVAQRPVVVATEVRNVSIGFQRVPTANITITETAAGVLRAGHDVRYSIETPATAGVAIVAGGAAVTAGDLVITAPTMDGFRIDTASKEASTVTLSNVALQVDRSAVFTNDRPLNFRLFGNAIIRNQGHTAPNETENRRRGLFPIRSLNTPYVEIATGAPDLVREEIRIGAENDFYTVGGREVKFSDGAAFIEGDNMMVPLRFIANALGISDENVFWSNADRKVYIRAPRGVVVIEIDSDVMMVAGVPMHIANGAKAVIRNERTYLPFRAVGNALGVQVDWDPEKREAIYNPQ